jgi:DNA-binding MarR family transcriptional regulator
MRQRASGLDLVKSLSDAVNEWKELARVVRKLSGANLKGEFSLLLYRMWKDDVTRPSDVERMFVGTNATYAIDVLCSRGYVTRTLSKVDKRCTILALTRLGQMLAQRVGAICDDYANKDWIGKEA